jgi:hypothetical protein
VLDKLDECDYIKRFIRKVGFMERPGEYLKARLLGRLSSFAGYFNTDY